MTPVSHGKPCAGNPHARFEEGASASETPRRNALLHRSKLWLIGALSGICLIVHAETEVIDGIRWTYTVVDGNAIVGGESSITAVPKETFGIVTIPTMMGGHPVVGIGEEAFYWCDNLTGVVIPDGVTSIGTAAFGANFTIRSLTIPHSVTNIGNYAINDVMLGLERVTIPVDLRSQVVERHVFNDWSIDHNELDIYYYEWQEKKCNILFDAVSGVVLGDPHKVVEAGGTIGGFPEVEGEDPFKGWYTEPMGGEQVFADTVVSGDVRFYAQWEGAECVGVGGVQLIIKDKTKLTGVVFPDEIGDADIVLPDTLTSIEANAFSGCRNLTGITISHSITNIKERAFENCTKLRRLTIFDGVVNIGENAFSGCSSLISVVIPDSVTSIGSNAFANCWLNFDGMPPVGVENVLKGCWYTYQEEYKELWELIEHKTALCRMAVELFVSALREGDPTVVDVCYIIHKSGLKNSIVNNVRALAFEDGVRSFAKVVRPETFVNDANGNPTVQNVGDNVAANVANTLSWKVSSDWAIRLAKVKFEVLVCDGALVPMKTMIIPASDKHGKMQISWNRLTNDQIFDALMWLYADKAAGLMLENGALKAGGKTLANGASLSDAKAAAEFVYRAMGFDGVLSGALLNYVNEETRLGLEPSGVRQYAYKMVEE